MNDKWKNVNGETFAGHNGGNGSDEIGKVERNYMVDTKGKEM